MNELSDKTRVVVTRSTGNYYVTTTQAEGVIKAMADKDAIIRIGHNVIAVNDISGVVGGDAIAGLERKKRGDWFCEKHNQWITKGKSCGYCGV